MKTKVSTVKNPAWKSANQHAEAHVETLADSRGSPFVIRLDLAKKVKMMIHDKGDATLKDASKKHMHVEEEKSLYKKSMTSLKRSKC